MNKKSAFTVVRDLPKKNGFVGGVQRYKCAICKKQFLGGERINNAEIWHEYVKGKQTYLQLSIEYGCSIKTIQRRIDQYQVSFQKQEPCKVIILMDTTYWGRSFGVMLFKDSITKENLLKYHVKHGAYSAYIQGIETLKQQGFVILAIVCDGRRGLFNLLKIYLYRCVSFINRQL